MDDHQPERPLRGFCIAGRPVGPGQPPLIVAEISGNHNGNKGRALRLLDAIAETGVEAVKFQTYTADTITLDHDGPDFIIRDGPWKGRRLYDLYEEAHTPWAWHAELFKRARHLGLIPFSSPFDVSAIEFLSDLQCPAFKIASFECIDLPLIAAAAHTNKPLIISTGLANQAEIRAAVSTVKNTGNQDFALLHCVSAYPAPADQYNLLTIPFLAQTYGVPAGLSDHTLGNTTAITAVALGACIIEKHITLSRDHGGPDAGFSATPAEFADLVAQVQDAWSALGCIRQQPTDAELGNLQFRRSLYVVRDIKAGAAFSPDTVKSIRPGYGLPPMHLPDIIGRTAVRDIPAGTPLTWNDVARGRMNK